MKKSQFKKSVFFSDSSLLRGDPPRRGHTKKTRVQIQFIRFLTHNQKPASAWPHRKNQEREKALFSHGNVFSDLWVFFLWVTLAFSLETVIFCERAKLREYRSRCLFWRPGRPSWVFPKPPSQKLHKNQITHQSKCSMGLYISIMCVTLVLFFLCVKLTIAPYIESWLTHLWTPS